MCAQGSHRTMTETTLCFAGWSTTSHAADSISTERERPMVRATICPSGGFPLSVGYPVVFQRSGPTLAQNQTGSLLHMQHCMRSCLSYLRRKEEVTPPVHPCRIRLDLSHAKLRELGEVFCPGDWDCVQGYCLNGAPAVLLLKIKIGMTGIVWYLKYEMCSNSIFMTALWWWKLCLRVLKVFL